MKLKLFILIILILSGIAFYKFGNGEKFFNSSLEFLYKTPLAGLTKKVQNMSYKNSGREPNNETENSDHNGEVEGATTENINEIDNSVETGNTANFDLKKLLSTTKDEFTQLSTRAQDVKEHAQNILGTTKAVESAVEASDNATPLHEKALKYGQYMYCKQVVQDYESTN